MSTDGTFYDSNHPWTKPFAPAAITPSDLKGKQLQVYFTQYVLNTMFDAGYTTGNKLDITYLLEKYLNVTLKTEDLDFIIPEL